MDKNARKLYDFLKLEHFYNFRKLKSDVSYAPRFLFTLLCFKEGRIINETDLQRYILKDKIDIIKGSMQKFNETIQLQKINPNLDASDSQVIKDKLHNNYIKNIDKSKSEKHKIKEFLQDSNLFEYILPTLNNTAFNPLPSPGLQSENINNDLHVDSHALPLKSFDVKTKSNLDYDRVKIQILDLEDRHTEIEKMDLRKMNNEFVKQQPKLEKDFTTHNQRFRSIHEESEQYNFNRGHSV
jgi:hypothetical protein